MSVSVLPPIVLKAGRKTSEFFVLILAFISTLGLNVELFRAKVTQITPTARAGVAAVSVLVVGAMALFYNHGRIKLKTEQLFQVFNWLDRNKTVIGTDVEAAFGITPAQWNTLISDVGTIHDLVSSPAPATVTSPASSPADTPVGTDAPPPGTPPSAAAPPAATATDPGAGVAPVPAPSGAFAAA